LAELVADVDDVCQDLIAKFLMETLPKSHPEHQENLDAYVKQRFRWLLLDRHRQLFGRPRPPVAMKQLGPRFPTSSFCSVSTRNLCPL
jgi:hypothetical protein